MFLNNEKSKRFVGGPRIPPRGPLPTTFATGAAVGVFSKQAVLNHCSKVWAPPVFGSQRTFERLPAIAAGTLPRPAASKFVVTVYHNPVCNVATPDISHPPNAFPTKSWRLLKNGIS